MREIRLILADLGLPVLSKEAACWRLWKMKAFGENVEIKARAVWNITGDIVWLYDSGLEVDYIGKSGGIYSARYMGEEIHEIKTEIIERLSQARDQSGVHGLCAILRAVCRMEVDTEETMEGLIAGSLLAILISYWPQYGVTSAQLTMEQKNEISHRGKCCGL